jgi:acid phosphatase (class A)
MLRRHAISMLVVAAISLSRPASAGADDKSCARGPDDHATALIKLLSPPPCDDCEETKAEVKELSQIQGARTQDDEKHAKDDIEITVNRFLDGAGIKFDAALLVKCSAFFDKLSKLTHDAADEAKKTFCRTRPYDLPGNTLRPLQQVKNSPSYPSGHTTYGTLIAAVLAEMLPERRDQIYARAADYGHSRLVAGVHFRSDVDAGKALGATLAADEFANDDEFKTAFPVATACVRDALGPR